MTFEQHRNDFIDLRLFKEILIYAILLFIVYPHYYITRYIYIVVETSSCFIYDVRIILPFFLLKKEEEAIA